MLSIKSLALSIVAAASLVCSITTEAIANVEIEDYSEFETHYEKMAYDGIVCFETNYFAKKITNLNRMYSEVPDQYLIEAPIVIEEWNKRGINVIERCIRQEKIQESIEAHERALGFVNVIKELNKDPIKYKEAIEI
jgi:hypothetical protein